MCCGFLQPRGSLFGLLWNSERCRGWLVYLFFGTTFGLAHPPLKSRFPRLFSITSSPLASITSHVSWDRYSWNWSFSWERALRPRYLDENASLDKLLQQVALSFGSNDKLIWSYSNSGLFSTKSLAPELPKSVLPPNFPIINGIWSRLVLHRIEVFAWSALLGRIDIRYKLASNGLHSASDISCFLCNKFPETCDHLLLHCEFSKSLWEW